MVERMLKMLHGSELPLDAPLVPVPTTRARERGRGYNQAELLARGVADGLGRRLVRPLARTEGNTTQTALYRSERLANVQNVFHGTEGAREAIGGTGVILVDDVLTTGATASAAAEALEEVGVEEVHLVTFARSLPEEGEP